MIIFLLYFYFYGQRYRKITAGTVMIGFSALLPISTPLKKVPPQICFCLNVPLWSKRPHSNNHPYWIVPIYYKKFVTDIHTFI